MSLLAHLLSKTYLHRQSSWLTMSDANNRPYEYRALEGDAKIRLLSIEPGSGNEKVRASLIPAAFDEDHGCVTPQSAEPPARLSQGDRVCEGVSRWHTTVYELYLWLCKWWHFLLVWILRPSVQKGVTATRTAMSREVLKYDAVSWAWGDPTKNAEIEILDEDRERFTFKVSRKLDQALRAVRSPNSVRTIWIDAVCIDQDNDMEKSHQVPMMDRIYGLAEKVCVWLGPVSDTHDAGTAFKLLSQLLEDMDYRKTVEAVIPAELEALSGMMRRDWFSRRWIIQEIALAKKAVVFCDRFSMDWIKFAQAIELFIEGESRMKLADNATLRHRSIPHYWKNVSALGAARLVREISAIRRLAPNAGLRRKHELSMSLEEIVCRLETFQTSKPHDTIYAYLALAKDAVPIAHLNENPDFAQKLLQIMKAFDMTKISAKAFVVDYNRPYAEVCCQFIKFAIAQQANRARALDILCRPWAYEEGDHTVRSELGLPKWVATIAAAPFEMTTHDSTLGLYRRNGDPFVGPPLKPIYNAADGAPVRDKILKFLSYPSVGDKPAVHSLIVTGFILDEIQIIKDKVTPDALVPEEWLNLGKWLDPRYPPPDALWKTLVGDRGPNGTSCPLSYPLCLESALKLSQSGRNLETSAITSHPDKYESFIAGFCSRVQEVVVNRRLIRTTRHKRLGLVSGREEPGTGEPPRAKSIRRGDLICILHGCSVPVVLRRVKKTPEQMELEDAQHLLQAEGAAKKVQKKWRIFLERRRARRWVRPCVAKLWRRTRNMRTMIEWITQVAIICWLSFPYTPWGRIFDTIEPALFSPWRALTWTSWGYLFGKAAEFGAWRMPSTKMPHSCVVTKDFQPHMSLIPSFLVHPPVFGPRLTPADFPQCPAVDSFYMLSGRAQLDNKTMSTKLVWGACQFQAEMSQGATTHVSALIPPFISALVSPFRGLFGCIRVPFTDFVDLFRQLQFWLLHLMMRLFQTAKLLDPSGFDWRVRTMVGVVVSILLLNNIAEMLTLAWRRFQRWRYPERNWAVPPTYENGYYYEFWGECYIDGMMDGYAVRVQNEVMQGNDEKAKQKMMNRIFELR